MWAWNETWAPRQTRGGPAGGAGIRPPDRWRQNWAWPSNSIGGRSTLSIYLSGTPGHMHPNRVRFARATGLMSRLPCRKKSEQALHTRRSAARVHHILGFLFRGRVWAAEPGLAIPSPHGLPAAGCRAAKAAAAAAAAPAAGGRCWRQPAPAQNWAVSVEPLRAVVELWPSETTVETAS